MVKSIGDKYCSKYFDPWKADPAQLHKAKSTMRWRKSTLLKNIDKGKKFPIGYVFPPEIKSLYTVEQLDALLV